MAKKPSHQLDLFLNDNQESYRDEQENSSNKCEHEDCSNSENTQAKVIRLRPTIDLTEIYDGILNRTMK